MENIVDLRLNLIPLHYGNIIKFGFIYGFSYRSHPPGIDVTIRAWGFFYAFFTPGRRAFKPYTPRTERLFSFLVTGSRFLVRIWPGNKNPFFPIWKDKNSITRYFQQRGQCPKHDNPRPYKTDDREHLDSFSSCKRSAGYSLCMYTLALRGFYREAIAM